MTETTGPGIFAYFLAFARVLYLTLGNWLVGLTPEENHWAKGAAWSRVEAYRWAAWHFRKYLTYSDDPRIRAHLGWCYAQLGMLESAAQHYRQAQSRSPDPRIAIGLAEVEADLGHREAARTLVPEARTRPHDLDRDDLAALDALEQRLRKH